VNSLEHGSTSTPAGEARADDARVASGAADARRTVDAIWRIEGARIVAGLARMVGDVGLAEDLAQQAIVDALEQ
jgi:DNA-directed RNA polymerase specialized sigma24 family protein